MRLDTRRSDLIERRQIEAADVARRRRSLRQDRPGNSAGKDRHEIIDPKIQGRGDAHSRKALSHNTPLSGRLSVLPDYGP